MKTIGIDIGTTTISMVVFDTENESIVKAVTIQNESFIETANEWERIQNAESIVEKTQAVLHCFLEEYKDIGSIGLTGQMHGILYLNEDGKCISPLFTWQDGRGDLPGFSGRTAAEMVRDECGTDVSTGYGLVTHLYNLKRDLVPAGSVSLCTIGDYFGMVLTGRKSPLLHISNAASLGFFRAEHGEFMEEALRKMGIDTGLLPAVTDEIVSLGTYRGIPVSTAVGDNQASFLGAVGIKENTLLLNMGTGGQISVLSKQYFKIPDIEARPFMKGTYLLVGSSLCGGKAYAILEKFFRTYAAAAGLKEESQYGIMEKLAEKTPLQGEQMKVVTSFSGTRADPKERGSISALSADNFTPAGLIRGVLQGMAQELYDMYGKIYAGTGISVMHLVASGNGIRKNKILQQFFSQMFQTELTMAPYEEEAACGAAISSTYQFG